MNLRSVSQAFLPCYWRSGRLAESFPTEAAMSKAHDAVGQYKITTVSLLCRPRQGFDHPTSNYPETTGDPSGFPHKEPYISTIRSP